MSNQITFTREVVQRVSDRKRRKLAIDESKKMLSDEYNDVDLSVSVKSQIEAIADSQSSMEGHRDLFGVLIPDDKWGCSSTSKTKSNKKTSVTKSKRKSPKNTPLNNSMNKPKRMGLNKSSSEVPVLSTDSLNVSGVQLLDTSVSNNNLNNTQNEKKTSDILKGVVAFVAYKIVNDQSAFDIITLLNMLGAIVEKTLNQKVTHVVFHDGHYIIYKEAMKRKIPLVTSKWVVDSHLSDKMMDPADYPVDDMEKYTRPMEKILIIPEYTEYKKWLTQSDIDRDNEIKAKCDSILEHVNNLKMKYMNKNDAIIEETPQKKKQKTLKNPDDIIPGFSDHLYDLLNNQDSPHLDDEEISELYIPLSIKLVRNYLTPKGIGNKTPSDFKNDLIEIEDRLKLNSQARNRFRRLLFNENKDVNNVSIISDIPSPSPQKLKISAPARLTSTKKQNLMLGKETLHQDKNCKIIKNTPEKPTTQTNVLRWNLRPRKTKKNIAGELTETGDNDINLLSRDSSLIFQTPKSSINSPEVTGKIACTGFTKNEVNTMKLAIRNLGTFTFHTNVELSTTYLITKSQPIRTLNMVFAMAFGCIIVSEKWVHESHKIGRWLPYEHYLISDLSSPVKEFQTLRNIYGSLLTFHIFDEVGYIYISNMCEPSAKQLKRLVRACGGKCTNIETRANVVVGKTPQINNNVNEKWILDCITQGLLLNKDQYLYDSR